MNCGHGDQEGHSIANLDGFQPPLNILEEISRENRWLSESRGESLRCEAPVEEQSAGKNDSRSVQQFATEDSEFVFRSSFFVAPRSKKGHEILDFIVGKSHFIGVCVVDDTETLA